MKALAAHPFHCPLSRDHWCECFACTTFSQPSSCGHQYGSSISEPFSLPSSCGLQYGSSVSTPVPSARPSRCLHLAAFNTGVPSACPSHCFTLRPSIREFHQHALLVALPCRLQYGSSISTPFSLLHLVAFNTRVPSARPSHCFTLRPSIQEFHQHALLVALPLAAFNTGVPLVRPSHCPYLAAFNALWVLQLHP